MTGFCRVWISQFGLMLTLLWALKGTREGSVGLDFCDDPGSGHPRAGACLYLGFALSGLTKPFHRSKEEQYWGFESNPNSGVLPMPRACLLKSLDLVAQGWSPCLKALGSYGSLG